LTTVAAGLAQPTTETVARQPESIRRTSHIDMIFPEGDPEGSLRLRGHARDLYTDGDGRGVVIAEGSIEADLDEGRRLRSLVTNPASPEQDALLGLVVGPGFRAAVATSIGSSDVTRSPMFLLLDDLPVAALISGYATMYESAQVDSAPLPDQDLSTRMVKADICSGWRHDGTMLVALRSTGSMPAPVGPPAPRLEGPDDPLGWHPLGELPPGSMRRRRLVDVVRDEPLRVSAMFRDTHMDRDGTERVLHEYTVDAAVDEPGLIFRRCQATPRSLPWNECPEAAASASRLVGHAAGEVRALIRGFGGTTTCTHLNDLLRSLGDVTVLASALSQQRKA
jgi:hypothetical protein